MNFPYYHPGLTPTTEGNYENDKYVFFWSGPFSNWYKCKFSITYSGHEFDFNCAEQAMMFVKAVMFEDVEIATKILDNNSPKEQKALGRMVKNFDDVQWKAVGVDFVSNILVHKFRQNPKLLKILLDTGDKHIVEASPYDNVWGIKMGVNHKDILDETKWQGTNYLGVSLMNARKILRNETERNSQ